MNCKLSPRDRLLAATLTALLYGTLSGCADSRASTACLPSADGVPVVASGEEGRWAREGLSARLVELWRAGGLAEGEELVYPASLSASAEGRLAITDFSLSEVIIVEPDGTWRGRWARRGEGPGELSTPVAATWSRDGTLAVYDLTGSKVLFLRDGASVRPDVGVSREVAAVVSLAGELPWAGVQPHGGILLEPPPMGPATAEGAPHPGRLLRYAPARDEPDTLVQVLRAAASFVERVQAPGWPALSAAIGTDGAIAVGGLDARYRIIIHDSAGRAVRVICRAAEALPMSPEERGADAAEDLGEEVLALREAPLPDTLASYGRMFWGARGRLWVQRKRTSVFNGNYLGAPGGPYDVFATDGSYLGEVMAPEAVRLQTAAGDTVFGFATGTLDETSVIAYRLVVE